MFDHPNMQKGKAKTICSTGEVVGPLIGNKGVFTRGTTQKITKQKKTDNKKMKSFKSKSTAAAVEPKEEKKETEKSPVNTTGQQQRMSVYKPRKVNNAGVAGGTFFTNEESKKSKARIRANNAK